MTSETLAHTYVDFDPPESADIVDGDADLSAARNVAEILDTIVRHAWRAFGADAAGILLVGNEGVASAAASGTDAKVADCLQVDHLQGPGLEAIKGGRPVLAPELRFGTQWRFWAPRVANLGFRSVLSLPLINGRPFGAVTLYSDRPSNFDPGLLAPGLEFVHQASLAITAVVEREQALRPSAYGTSLVMHKAAS